jgi:hypothetical protein
MFPQIASLPFRIINIYLGLGTAHGVVRSTEAELILEFQIKDTVAGLVKSPVTEIRIPMNELLSIELKEGWFRQRLVIRARSLATLSSVPGHESGRVVSRSPEKTCAQREKWFLS